MSLVSDNLKKIISANFPLRISNDEKAIKVLFPNMSDSSVKLYAREFGVWKRSMKGKDSQGVTAKDFFNRFYNTRLK